MFEFDLLYWLRPPKMWIFERVKSDSNTLGNKRDGHILFTI